MSVDAALRTGAVLAAASAVSTFLLWLLPRFVGTPADFVAMIALHENPWHLARLWVNFVHNWIALFAYMTMGYVLARRAPGWTAAGLAAFAIWAVVELVGIAVSIFAVNGSWRARYRGADVLEQASLRLLLDGWDAVWDAMFFVLLIAFLIGSLCYGLAAIRGTGFERLLGALLLAAVPLTGLIIAGGYANVSWAGAIASAVYPVLQPASRLVMGACLWRASKEPRFAAASVRRPLITDRRRDFG